MKGTTYSGIVHLPEHPDADLHGLVRVAIRDLSFLAVAERLSREFAINVTGGWNLKIWNASRSHVEELATERQFGVLLVCPLAKQYLDPAEYKPLRKSRRQPTAPAKTGMVPKESLR